MSQSDFVTRGQALVTAGQYQEAVKVCRLGLLGRPTTVEGRIVLGQALLALKRYDEVLAEMRVALELDHGSVGSQVLKGEALLRKGDAQAAIDVLAKVRALAPTDPRVGQLLGEAERAVGKPRLSASHPSVGFVGSDDADAGDSDTKHYPTHGADEEDTGAPTNDAAGAYTRPTSLSAPGLRKRSNKQKAVGPDGLPSPAVLAVGDRSGTVEVDPEMEGVEVESGDDDLGDVVAPPSARGAVKAASARRPEPARKPLPRKADVSSVELDSDDVLEIEEPVSSRPPGPGTAVRNAVRVPAGPIDLPESAPRPPAIAAAVPPMFSQSPLINPRSQIAAALPTAAAMPMPPPPSVVANAARPTIALTAAQQQSAAAVDALFTAEPAQPAPAWARATMAAGRAAADEPTRQPHEIDPQLASLVSGNATPAGGEMSVEVPIVKARKTGVRKGRSRLQVAIWILIGGMVIGGGVFAGFQIRAMRLNKQIAAARDQAVDLAKADTWQGWAGARDRIAGIAHASATVDNFAALARARAVLAYEFGDGLADAKTAVDKLGAQGGLDAAIAAAYVALAQNDPKAAKQAADHASELGANDAAVLYLTGQALLLAGDYKGAITSLRTAHEREPRPLYAIGLGRAIAATGAWEDALAAVDRALGAMPDHPAGLIERAFLLAQSGRIAPGNTIANEIRAQLAKIIAEGAKPISEQTRGISPAQVALANLALCQVDFALRDLQAVRADFRAALAVGVDEQRFAEEAIDTLYLIGEVGGARAAAERALATWPGSRRSRISQAQIAIALGKPTEALEIFTKSPDVVAIPRGQAIRGQARLLTGDVDGAKADFEAALKKQPQLEIALVGAAWIDLAAGDLDEARKRIEPKYNPNNASIALTTVYAAILRTTGDFSSREKARAMLEKAVTAPPTVEIARAQLELARIYRDLGDVRAARKSYEDASRANNTDARLESALLQIEDRDPAGGRDTLELLLKDAGDHPSPTLLLETARARMLVGDHAGATQLLDLADQSPNVQRWQLDRERGRLLLRRGDTAGAAQTFSRALDSCGGDTETFLLAADVISADNKQAALITKLKQLGPLRLKTVPEGQIVAGKLALAAGNDAEADAAYQAARKALDDMKATQRRLAQAHFGLAVIAYNRGDDPNAQSELDLVTAQDPSIYTAYLFAAEIAKTKKNPGAATLALNHAQRAVQFNPDYLDGWFSVGQLAAKTGNKKLLEDAVTRVGALAPGSDKLKELQALKP